ncbi:trithorax group protein osa-like [Phymastichus coffea]|uniref:trithorax group protein osa-like n=1 Tax=Phymastichus coffea TaxID=108790 RepID=UPI00273C3D25|nr:trithorax group protein osa-like [Phymastichus coffea]
MARFKVTIAVFCVLLIGQQVTAVINKAPSTTEDDEKSDSVAAEDRISDSFGPPVDDYGPPPSSGFIGPAPVYGPPELTGDHRPPQVYDPLPAERPPPPSSSYGLPSKPKPQYGPPKSTYGPPKSNFRPGKPKHGPSKLQYGPPKSQYSLPKPQYGPPKPQYSPSKPQYGPPKLQYGPPKPQYGPPSSRLPKPEYGPPSKFNGAPSPQYGSPAHGPPIPLSDTYAPLRKPTASFVSKPQNDYGPPPAQQQQFGSPGNNDIYGPPLPPAAGVPAPPTPPDIKYDGWQPIAGHVSVPQQQLPPSDNYGPPPPPSNDYGVPPPSNDYGVPPPSNDYGVPPPSKDYGIPPPSNDYGVPPPSNDYGVPPPSKDYGIPPPSNDYGVPPPSNDYGPPLASGTPNFEADGRGSDIGHVNPVITNPNIPHDSYGIPLANPEDHNLKQTVSQSTKSHESDGLPPPPLPQNEPIHNIQPPIASSPSNQIDHHHSGGQFGNGLSIVKTVGYELLPNPGALQGGSLKNRYGTPAFGNSHSGGDDLSLQQLPAPSGNYGPPSFSSSGTFSSSGHHGGSFSSFNHFGTGFQKNRNRNRGGHRSGSPPGGFIPPRRPPSKFRDSVPAGLFNNLNKYLPPSSVKPHKTYGVPEIQDQQLPSLQGSSSFPGSSSSSFASSSFGKSNSIVGQVPLAAPNVNYGTPLSFNDFNTPAPSLTYGAPNFKGPSSLGSGGNLYSGIENSIVPTYGTPAGNGYDCQNNGGSFVSSQPLNLGLSNQNSFVNAGGLSLEYGTPDNSVGNALGSNYATPNMNQLELQSHNQQGGDLRDSYGNPIDVLHGAADQSGAAGSNLVQSVTGEFSDVSSHSQNSLSADSSLQGSDGITAEALTAALTAQGYSTEAKNIVPSTEVDPTQFIKSEEGGQALALAQTLSSDGDGFQIQGSQGTYTLQIQSADSYGAEASNGNIRHDQVLSNGLLQNILAAIEQPTGGQIQIQMPQSQAYDQSYGSDLALAASSSIPASQSKGNGEHKQSRSDTSPIDYDGQDQEGNASEESKVALYFNKEVRSTSNNEKQADSVSNDQTNQENEKST